MRRLLDLAEASGLRQRIDAMFRGERINVTEDRAVLHVALRTPRGQRILVDGEDVVPKVHAVLDRMADFADRVRRGAFTGYTGRRLRNIVNIGIGGSDLGPVMAYEALRHYSERALTLRFVSNVDATDFAILKASFGKGFSDPGYDDRADFNGDQVVNAADFSLLRATFGTAGAPPIGP